MTTKQLHQILLKSMKKGTNHPKLPKPFKQNAKLPAPNQKTPQKNQNIYILPYPTLPHEKVIKQQ